MANGAHHPDDLTHPVDFYERMGLAYHSARDTYHGIIRDADAYARAPGCGGHEVDHSLPPCTIATAVVVSKTTHQVHSDVNVSGDRTAYDISVREASGQITQYEDVYENFWNRAQVGGTIREQYWQGRLHELDAGHETYPIITQAPMTAHLMHKAMAWIAVSILALGFLCSLWAPRRSGLYGFALPRLLR
ncbi:MAG TPA: hypothetical protein VFW40_00965 [Capsulimonadaceae bacterium]|nr:hypothetical protein [Capsulimonadaceae bacterium]